MYIRVHAIPGARRERVVPHADQAVYTISVKEPAERNMANNRIRAILADLYQCPSAQVRLLTGHRSSSKLYVVDEKGD